MIAPILADSFEILATRSPCPITAATFLNIFADLFATLVMSNSESLACYTCCILRTIVGEQIESFLTPVLAMQQDISAKCSVLDVQKRPLRRCITLENYVHTLKCRPQRDGSPETLRHLSKADVDALRVVNMALQNMSDENDLAVLRICSARELRHASDITQCSNTTVLKASKNHRQSDYTLALQGYALGERYAFGITNNEVQSWIRLLPDAGSENSVSNPNWCMDDWLTLDVRIFVLGQHQSFQ